MDERAQPIVVSCSSSLVRHLIVSVRLAVLVVLQVEVKPDMVGHYLAEFAITYKPCKHGRAGLGGAAAARFVPLK